MASKRVCVIGGGPGAVGGLEVLHQMASYAKRLPEKERDRLLPTLVCYEQQASPGEMWNLDWRVGEFMDVDDCSIPKSAMRWYPWYFHAALCTQL